MYVTFAPLFFFNFLFYKILFCVVFFVGYGWMCYGLFTFLCEIKNTFLKMLTTVYFFQIFVVVVAEHSCIQLPTLFFSSFADFRGYFFRYKIWFPFPLLILLPLLKIVTNSIYTKPCPLCVSNFFTISWGDHHYGYRISFNTVWHAADTFHFGHTLFVRIVKTFFTKGSTWWYGF